MDTIDNGFWLAYHTDWSGWRAFVEEIDALRFAVQQHMDVKFVEWGQDPREP